MERLGIHHDHLTPLIYALLMGEARKACKKRKLSSLTLEDVIEEVKKRVLFDDEIKVPRVTHWTTATFENFRQNADSDEKAMRKCLEFVNEYQRGLPKHLLAEEHLYNRIRFIFRSIAWCETLFQRIKAHDIAISLSQKLISAAVNHDMRATIQHHAIAPFHASLLTVSCLGQTETPWFNFIAFFSKTPPLSRHRRPSRFNQSKCYRSRHRPLNRSNHSSARTSRMHPQAL